MTINIEQLKRFSENHYTRNLVLKTDNVEMILLGWMPGHVSPLHSHGPTDGIILVLDGELTNTNLYPDGHQETVIWKPGDIGHTPVGIQHEVANHSKTPTLTLHVYAPPLGDAYKPADMGYDNTTHIEEVQLPDSVIRFLVGGAHPEVTQALTSAMGLSKNFAT